MNVANKILEKRMLTQLPRAIDFGYSQIPFPACRKIIQNSATAMCV